jgi:uncharacterized repeat protein (TIGR02543 family)
LTSAGGATTSGSAPVDPNSPYVGGASATVLGNLGSLTLSGYSFADWCTTDNAANPTECTGGKYNTAGAFTMPASNVTLYSVWILLPTDKVNFNSEGGSAVASISGPDGSSIALPVAPTYAGHTFLGWFAAASGGSALTSPYTLTGSLTLYAGWSTNAKSTTTSLVVSRSSVVYGDESAETFTVTVTGSGTVLPTGTVTIKSNSTTLCSTSTLHRKTADSVTASCRLSSVELDANSYSVTAFYTSNTANYAGSNSSGSQMIKVGKAAITVLAVPEPPSAWSLSAIVIQTSGDAPISGLTLRFMVGGITVCSATTDAIGVATCVMHRHPPGETYTVELAGNADYTAGSATAEL